MAGKGTEESKCPSCLSFGGEGGAKMPFLKCNFALYAKRHAKKEMKYSSNFIIEIARKLVKMSAILQELAIVFFIISCLF